MKRGLLILLLFTLSFDAYTQKKKTNKQPSLNGSYTMMSHRSEGKLKNVNLTESNLVFNSSEKSISIFVGCNRLTAQYQTQLNKKLKFTLISSTRMACPNNFEDIFKSNLSTITNYTFKDDILNLYKGKILIMQLQRDKNHSVPPTIVSLEGNYKLEQLYNGSNLVKGDFKKTSFQITQNQINCSVGCNRIGGEFKTNDHKILPLKLMMTEMYCADVDALEKQFVDALNQIDQYKLNDNILTFSVQNKILMILKRKDE